MAGTDRVMSEQRSRPEAQSAAAPSPFPAIADYAFLSNCHTGALVAPDGSVDWLCVPRFDSPSVFAALLDRQAGSFRLAPFGVTVPNSRTYEPGTNTLVTTWNTRGGWVVVRDALTMGPRIGEDRVTPYTRPPADDGADHMLVRTVQCIEGQVEIELACEPVFDYGRTSATWTLARGRQSGGRCGRRRPESFACRAASVSASRATACVAATRSSNGEEMYCCAVLGRGAGLPRDHRRRQRPHGGDDPFLAHLDRPRPHSRSPLAIPHHALGARHQGAHLPADRGHGRRADDFPARDARRRAQLGLPLQLDAQFDVHAAGAALAEPRLGSQRVHGIRRRPQAQRRRRPADHVRHRWPPRSHRVRRATTCPATPARARYASATVRSTSARTTSSAPCWDPSCCIRGEARGCPAVCGRSSSRRPSAPRGCGVSRTRASGRRAARPSTMSPRS